MDKITDLHEKAKNAVKVLERKEWELILILQEVVRHKVYEKYKYPSFFKYLTLGLGLSESKAYDFSVVARATLRFSKLNSTLAQNKLSIAKARRIASVLNEGNQDEWIKRAQKSSHRMLEKLVAGENPQISQESSRYVSAKEVEVRIVMSEKEYEAFKRAQDLLCQKEQKPVTMRATLTQMTRQFLEKQDPVVRAARKQKQKVVTVEQKPGTCQEIKADTREANLPNNSNRHIPAHVFHQVQLRDRGRCQETMPNGQKCEETRWIDIHHIKPLSKGGNHSIYNLQTLCKGHHRIEHSSS